MPGGAVGVRLSDSTLRALRHADQVIRASERHDLFRVYDACRAAVGSIAALDDFYFGLINSADRRISYPYLYSNGAFEDAGTVTYGPNGLCAWIVASRRPYRYADDDGAVLHRGMRFGDEDQSADAVIVPLIGGDDEGVMGVMGALSDTPNTFTGETVSAMEWLAGIVVDRLHAGHPTRRLNLRLVYPELEDDGRSGVLNAVNRAGRELTDLAVELQALAEVAESGVGAGAGADEGRCDEVKDRLAALARRCFEIQANLVTRVGPHHEAPRDPLAALSPRERAVVELVTGPEGDPGNAGIAQVLGISQATVKTHMSSLLDKLGLEHRSELRWLVRTARL